MLRFIARAFGILAVLLPLSAAAQLVPSNVNLHKGYIEVINHVQYHDGFSHPGVLKLNGHVQGDIGSGGRLVLNHCCILAGSQYVVELDYVRSASQRSKLSVTPRLCNIRGIPFGYAVVVYTGSVVKTREGSGTNTRFEMFHFSGRRVDTSCPVEK